MDVLTNSLVKPSQVTSQAYKEQDERVHPERQVYSKKRKYQDFAQEDQPVAQKTNENFNADNAGNGAK